MEFSVFGTICTQLHRSHWESASSSEVEGGVKSLWVRNKHLSLMRGCLSSQMGFGSVKTFSRGGLGQDQNLRVIPKSDKKITSRPLLCMSGVLHSTPYPLHIHSPQVGHTTTVPVGDALNPFKHVSPQMFNMYYSEITGEYTALTHTGWTLVIRSS